MENFFVTGAAGFIGSSLVDRLLQDGKSVVGWDNFSTGQRQFLSAALANPRFKLIEGDNLDLPALTKAMVGCDTVFHFAANADVRFGLEHPSKDLQQNAFATFNVLEAMRANGIQRIAFSSTGSVLLEGIGSVNPPGSAALAINRNVQRCGAPRLMLVNAAALTVRRILAVFVPPSAMVMTFRNPEAPDRKSGAAATPPPHPLSSTSSCTG